MRVFKIPESGLDLFLVALNMNFNVRAPDYIFQTKKGYDVVFTFETRLTPNVEKAVDQFVQGLWDNLPEEPFTPKLRGVGTAIEDITQGDLVEYDAILGEMRRIVK